MRKWRWISILLLINVVLLNSGFASSTTANFSSPNQTIKKADAIGVVWETPDASTGSAFARLNTAASNWFSENNHLFDHRYQETGYPVNSFLHTLYIDNPVRILYSKSYLDCIYPFHRFW